MKKIIAEFKRLDKNILSIVRSGLRFSFVFCLFATLILIVYESVHNPHLFEVGISLFRTSLFFIVAFVTYGFIFNKIKNDLT